MKKKNAFTLIELMGVLVIIGILMVILVPVINNIMKNNKQELYNQQIDFIKLSAKNLASDNSFILPEVTDEVIYITLGQLRAMGYAEETIINPLTKENFSDDLIIMIIKSENDYNYEIELNGEEIVTVSGIMVNMPSKKYIKSGSTSSYIIMAKTTNIVDDKQMEYYINVEKDNILIKGAAKDDTVKYKLDGSGGLYKLTILGGEKEGLLYFNFNDLKDIDQKVIDVHEINEELNNVNSNKQIIVDNTAPVINFTINGTSVWQKSVNTKIEVTDNNGSDALDNNTYKYAYSLSSSKDQELNKTYNLTEDVIQSSGDGEYYLIAQACDKAGNCAKEISNKYLVDNISPTCNWSGQNTTWTKTPVTVTLTGIDNHKMNTAKTTYSKIYNESGVEIKTSPLSYEIEDEAGNKTNCGTNVNVYYDTKAPTSPNVKLVSGDWAERQADTWYNTTTYVSGTTNYSNPNPTSTDSGSGIKKYQISMDNNNWEDWYYWNYETTSKGVYNVSTEGTNYRYIRAVDEAGNISDVTTKIIKIDTTAPIISSINTGDCSNGKRTVTINAYDSLSGIAGYNITTSYNTPSFDSSSSGSYSPGTYYAWVKDNAGNITYQSFTVSACVTASDICNTSYVDLFGTAKDKLEGNSGSWYSNVGNWPTGWCYANNTQCTPSGGNQRICVGDKCSEYGIYGKTAIEINETYGCSFAKLWCSCS